jgi:hypothetical protein
VKSLRVKGIARECANLSPHTCINLSFWGISCRAVIAQRNFWTGCLSKTHKTDMLSVAILPAFYMALSLPVVNTVRNDAAGSFTNARPSKAAFRAEPPKRRYEVSAPMVSRVGKRTTRHQRPER